MKPLMQICCNGLAISLLASPFNAYAADESWWKLEGSYRLRYENLDNAYRANSSGSDQILFSRLLIGLALRGEHLFGMLELEDARAWLEDAGTPLGTDDVNALEPLQAYVGWQHQFEGGRFAAKAGRMTIDVGSRRLVARNRFRNTLNAFTGVHAELNQEAWQWTSFYTLPLQREPAELDALDANRARLDREYSGVRFWGLHAAHDGEGDSVAEIYLFDLEEADQPELPTQDRDIATLGFRLLQPAKAGHWGYELEAAYQYGESRAQSTRRDVRDLDHRAGFMHAQLAYQFADRWSSRIAVEADYASGDDDPNDGENNRFDTLFGARRFDFGPTGIYGAFARSNILSPGMRWEFKPAGGLSALIGYRAIWLASERDALTTAGVRDASGNTDRFVGQQLETSLSIKLSPQFDAELGAAYLRKGAFLRDAPNAPDAGNTRYIYTQLTYKF